MQTKIILPDPGFVFQRLGSPSALNVFFGSVFCQFFLWHGFVVACLFPLPRPRWQPKYLYFCAALPLLLVSPSWYYGRAGDLSTPFFEALLPLPRCFFLEYSPPKIACVAMGESLFGSVSALLASKKCFMVLVASPTSGPPGKGAGGIAVIFERWGGRWYPPALLKTTANPYLQPLAMVSQRAPEMQKELLFPCVSGARGPSVYPSPQNMCVNFLLAFC